MIIREEDPEFDRYLVFLDGKWVRSCLAASDDEGWVDVLDESSFPPCTEQSDAAYTEESAQVSEWEECKAVRKFGKVQLRKLPPR